MFGRYYFGARYFGPYYFGSGGGAAAPDPAYLIASVRIYAAMGEIEMDIEAALNVDLIDVYPALDDVEISAISGLEGDVEIEPALLGNPKANRRLN